MILADNGSPWFFQGAPDRRWNDSDLNSLKRLTGSDFWLNLSAYFLGPNLNAMPAQLLSPDAGLQRIRALPTPWVSVDLAHTLAVTLVWSLAFAAAAVILTWRRDVNE